MITYIIADFGTIKGITGKDIYKKIILHLDNKKKEAKYESDFTLFELTEKLDYSKVKLILENN
jgi:predicted polyphosphate/ATP-dependent NAD kinase